MKTKITDAQTGFAHYFLPLLILVIVGIGGGYHLVNSSSAATTPVAETAKKKKYTYKRISNSQVNRFAKIGYNFWGSDNNLCGKNSKNLKISYFEGNFKQINLADLYEQGGDWTIARDEIAYTYVQNPACTIYVNELAMRTHMKKGVKFSTARSMCFTIVHEMGHLLEAKNDIYYGDEKGRSLSPTQLLMSYYWIDRMENKSFTTGGPHKCQSIR